MGRPGGVSSSSGTLAATRNERGELSLDALVSSAPGAAAIVHSRPESLRPRLDRLEGDLSAPDEEEVKRTREETAKALEAVVQRRQAAVDPSAAAAAAARGSEAQYVRYTPSASAAGPHVGTRIVRIQDAPVDPLEPPKFRHVKVPRGDVEPPVPVLHSPPRKLSKEDAAAWKIPPCVSNWKNNKGYSIPLHARLAADGRGLAEVALNDRFAKLSEAMYVAEQSARDAVEARAAVQREIATRERDRREQELREMAAKARADRLGGGSGASASVAGRAEPEDERRAAGAGAERPGGGGDRRGGGGDDAEKIRRPRGRASDDGGDSDRDGAPRRHGSLRPGASSRSPSRSPARHRDSSYSPSPDRRSHPRRRAASSSRSPSPDRRRAASSSRSPPRRRASSRSRSPESPSSRRARLAREALREERRRERERERRLDAGAARAGKRSKASRDRERDVSEQVALGQARVSAAPAGDAAYDARLFGRDAGGTGGFGAEDDYALYDKPLFADRSAVYRGRAGEAARAEGREGGRDGGARRFRPDRGFEGVDYDAKTASDAAPTFERAGGAAADGARDDKEDDPFGIDRFLSEVRGGRK